MSATRKNYILRLLGRIVVLILCGTACFTYPQIYNGVEGTNFFRELSVLHILWLLWVIDMALQIIPIKNKVPLGSQKLFANRFRPIREKMKFMAI